MVRNVCNQSCALVEDRVKKQHLQLHLKCLGHLECGADSNNDIGSPALNIYNGTVGS